MKILVLNAESSSQKICLYELAGDEMLSSTPPAPLWAADADWSHNAGRVTITVSVGTEQSTTEQPEQSRRDLLAQLLQTLWQGERPVVKQPADIAVVGHRVVQRWHWISMSIACALVWTA